MPFNLAQLARGDTSQAQGAYPIDKDGTGSLARTTSDWGRFLGILGSGLIAMVFNRLVVEPAQTTLVYRQLEFGHNPEILSFSFWYERLLDAEWILPHLVWDLLPWALAISAALLFLRLFRGMGTAAVLSLAFNIFAGFFLSYFHLTREVTSSVNAAAWVWIIRGSMSWLLVSLPILLAPLTLGRIRSRSEAILLAVVGGTMASAVFSTAVTVVFPQLAILGLRGQPQLVESTFNPLISLVNLCGGVARSGVWALLWIRFVRPERFEAAMMRKPLSRSSP